MVIDLSLIGNNDLTGRDVVLSQQSANENMRFNNANLVKNPIERFFLIKFKFTCLTYWTVQRHRV
jgi:hypothetical protein